MRWAVRLLLFAALALVAADGAVAGAVGPPGPRLALIVSQPYPNTGSEVATVDAGGESPLKLSGGPGSKAVGPINGARPSWSADGSVLAFVGVAGAASAAIYVVNADGTHLHLVRASRRIIFEGDPVLAPDGRSVAVMRLDVISGHFERPGPGAVRASQDGGVKVRTAIWSLDVDGKGMHPLTRWRRDRALFPSSYSPDGSALAATRVIFRGDARTQAVSIDLVHGGRAAVLAENAGDPTYAPDGSVVAVRHHTVKEKGPLEEERLLSSDLLVGAPGSTMAKVLTVRGGLDWPSWDPSSQRIAFTTLRDSGGGVPGLLPSNSIEVVNADGTCPSTLLSLKRGSFSGAAWQPGLERGAGRLAC
jgi:Tol biopolymer transport system component